MNGVWTMGTMGMIGLLAQAAATQPSARPCCGEAARRAASSWLHLPAGHWPGQGDLLNWAEHLGAGTAAVLVLLGVVYLLFGFYLFRFLVVANVAVIGAAVGALAGDRGGYSLPGGLLGGFVSAVVTWPLMRGAVTLMGALFGALIGGTIWRLIGLEPDYTWSGALTGLVACGLVCFIAYRESLMAHTSLQGAVMVVFGALALLMKYHTLAESVTNYLGRQPLLLPTLVLIPAILGTLFQRANNGDEASAAAPAGGDKPKK